MNIIYGAGTLLYYFDNYYRYLLILNSETKIWEPAKGIKEKFESHLSCAIRECKEETSVIIGSDKSTIIAPQNIEYFISPNYIKRFKIFPIKLESKPKILLSEEHINYKWITYNQAVDMFNSLDLKKCYFDLIGEIENTEKFNISETKSQITKSLEGFIHENSIIKKHNWFLGGSLSSNEYTLYNDKILSDIDLVAFSDVPPNRNELTTINSLIFSHLKKFTSFYKLNVGTMFVEKKQGIDSSTLFGSYFEQFHEPISKSYDNITFENRDSENNDYNIFRMFWYAFLRENFYDAIESQYTFLKSNLLYYFFKNRDSFNYFSYTEIKNKILNDIIKCTNSKEEERLIMLLRAIDTKLNNANFLDSEDWKGYLVDELIVLNKDCEKNEDLILNEIYNIQTNQKIGSYKFLNFLIKYFDFKTLGDLYEIALHTNDSNIRWIILIILRIHLWPDQVQFSLDKYKNYIRTFANKSITNASDSTKELLGIILNHFQLDDTYITSYQTQPEF